VLAALVSGALAGWAVAVPVGMVGAYLVALAARTSLRVGVAAALGVATADGAYALVAVLSGSAVAAALASVDGVLRAVSVAALLVLAALSVRSALRPAGAVTASAPSSRRAFLTLLGITIVNPATVVTFAALVAGDGASVSSAATGAVFVAAAFLASASWQLLLALGGAGLGHVVTSERGRLVTALVSAGLLLALAASLLLR
jgi:arginine exporter protein ArgO